MKNIYLLDKYISSGDGSNLKISKIKNNGITIVDIIDSNLNQKFNISVVKEKEQNKFLKSIDSLENHIIWPLNIFPNDINELKSVFERIMFSIYDVKIYPKLLKSKELDKKFNNLDLINNDINFIYYKTNNNLSFNTKNILEIKSKSLTFFSNQRTFFSLMSKKPVSRNFNELVLEKNVYEKSSKDISKLRREFFYIKDLPMKLKNFFPQLLNTELNIVNNSKASYRINYIPGENMAGILLGDKLNEKQADLFYKFILDWLNSIDQEKITKFTISEFLIQKCFQRFDEIKKFGIYDHLYSTCQYLSIIEPEKLLGIIINNLKKYSDKINEFPPGYYHGDLCLSNIIFYQNSYFLIDPRGFDKKNPKLNIIYEFAKLRHSIINYYDVLNSGNASINIHLSSEILIKYNENNSYKIMRKVYYDLIDYFSIPDSLIKVVEASLFFTMIPLHKENLKRVLSFYLTSIKIIKEV